MNISGEDFDSFKIPLLKPPLNETFNNTSSSQSGLDPGSPKLLITLDIGPSISRGQACAGMMMLPVRQGLAKLLISIYYRVFSNDRLGEYSRKD